MSATTYTQTDLTAKKVNDLKAILTELSLPTNGVKADLIARILEHQQQQQQESSNTSAPLGATSTTGGATATATEGTDLPAAGNALGGVPSEDKLPATTTATNEAVATSTQGTATGQTATTDSSEANPGAAAIELPSLPSASNAQTEHEKRLARLARFGNTEELAKLQRAEKFGTAATDAVDDKTISKLDSELSNKRIRPQGGPAAAAASSNGKAGTAFASTPKNGTNANAKRPASASTKPKATSTKPVSAGNQQQKKKREAPPLDPAEEEKRKKRAERFGQQA